MERDALRRGMQLHYIALPGQTQGIGDDGQTAEEQQIASALPEGGVVGPLMEQVSLHGTQVFLPLLLQMDQRPLPAAERKVLDSGEREEVLLTIDGHPMRMQVIPAGREDSSTVTV